jgi:hypothetical protein
MRKKVAVILCSAALAAGSALAGSGDKSHPGWERLKNLVGDWEGTYGENQPVRASYKLVSGGSALMETLHPGANEPEMITMYHLDNGKLMLTHYCSEANQPRLKAGAATADGSKLEFAFMDGTNIAPDAGHMKSLVVTFQDADHFEQRWTHAAKGKEHTGHFRFARKK